MLVTVSTVKDDLVNIESFVGRNVARGVGHMVICLDTDQPEVEAAFEGHDRVTVVPERGWWSAGGRPDGLNQRQAANASTVNALLTTCPWASWLFHIDGDEVLDVDVERLRALPPEISVVELSALEVVNPGAGPPPATTPGETLFKRVPTTDELVLLTELGLIRRPAVQQYFRGHLGKSGLRPTLDYSVAVHRPFSDGKKVMGHRDERMRLLHLESASFAEFVRKWRNLIESSSTAQTRMRPRRRLLAGAIRELLTSSRSEEDKTAGLRLLYEEWAVDHQVDLLWERGLLDAVALDDGLAPQPPPSPAEAAQLRSSLASAGTVARTAFWTGSPHQRTQLLAQVVASRW